MSTNESQTERTRLMVDIRKLSFINEMAKVGTNGVADNMSKLTGEDATMDPGMIWTIEPGLYTDTAGYRHSDTVAITEDGIDRLKAEVPLFKKEVTVGEEGKLRFTVVNASDEAVELTFRDSGRADFAVYTEADAEIWRWSDGRMFMQVIQYSDLQPGQEATFTESWPDPVPGDYTAEATLRAVDHDVGARTPFSV